MGTKPMYSCLSNIILMFPWPKQDAQLILESARMGGDDIRG